MFAPIESTFFTKHNFGVRLGEMGVRHDTNSYIQRQKNDKGSYSEPGNRNKEEKTQNLRHIRQLGAKRRRNTEGRRPC